MQAWRTLACAAVGLIAVAAGAMAKSGTNPTNQAASVRLPPPDLRLDPFYRKYVDADGIPVTTSDRVPDFALLAARGIVLAMLSRRTDLRDQLIAMGARVGIMAETETTTDLPEQRYWRKPAVDDPRLSRCDRDNYQTIADMTDRQYWARRARGMGGVYTTAGAENILGIPGTRYFGENILVHEFAHVMLAAIRRSDPELHARIEAAYADARANELWKSGYASINVDEYWAEGVQFWFNSNMAYKAGGVTVASAEDLRRHDPELYDLLGRVYRADHRIVSDIFYRHAAQLKSRPVNLANDCYS